MKIGVWLDSNYDPQDGGAASYYGKLIKAIDRYNFDNSLEIIFLTYSDKKLPFKKKVLNLKTPVPKLNIFSRFIISLVPVIGKRFKRKRERKIKQKIIQINLNHLIKNSVKLIYYLRQAECEFPNFPFIATNWDIGHCSTYAFPEITANGQFERRDKFYREVLPKALNVFCESEAGKKELLQFTGIIEDKIKVIPLFAGGSVDLKVTKEEQTNILNEYQLSNGKFFFYPAQFWPHKNQYSLIQAFKIYIQNHPGYKLVLTGSDKGNKQYIKSIIEKENLSNQIHLLGFVSNEEINTFYMNAASLVMPSYFGPTNMPPIEAMELGCLVICSDLAGHREILKDSALYFNPMYPEEIATCMKQIVNKKIRKEKQDLLRKENKETIFKVEYSLKQIDKYLSEIVLLRNNWE